VLMLCSLAAACGGDATSPLTSRSLLANANADTLASGYRLGVVNSRALPCCNRLTSDGKTESWIGGELDFGKDGTYRWTLELRFDWQPAPMNYYTSIVDSLVAHGTYSRQADRIVFSDSGSSSSFTGSVAHDSVTLVHDGTSYRLGAIPAPTLFKTSWPIARCIGSAGFCADTNAAGVVATPIAEQLQFDVDVPLGHYLWDATYEYRHPGGVVDTARVQFSRGTYSLYGTTLTMNDSTNGRGTMTGHFSGALTIQVGSETYMFSRLFSLPGG
jgi:hypothetical protein